MRLKRRRDRNPEFRLHHCVIYTHPDAIVISNSPDRDGIINIQHTPGVKRWAWVTGCRFEAREEMEPGTIRIRPMTPGEVREHEERVNK